MSKILMTYSNSHERLCNEYLDIYKNSLIFDKDRKSIYTQGQEFGYISSIHISEQKTLNTNSLLYNDYAINGNIPSNKQIISNIHFDRINGLSYTYSDLRTDVNTQSVNIDNNIISISLIKGALVLSKYTPVKITEIALFNGANQINNFTEPNSINPIEITKDVDYTDIKIKVTNETRTCAVEIDKTTVGPAYDGLHTLAGSITDMGEYLADYNINDTNTWVNIDIINGTINHKTNNELVVVEVAVQDRYETLTNPPSISKASIKLGWFYKMYFGHDDYDGIGDFTNRIGNYSTTGKANDNDIKNKKFSFIYIQNIEGYVKEYNSEVNYSVKLSRATGVDGNAGETFKTYILIPTKIALSSDMRFLWNNDMYETPNEANIDNKQYYKINGIEYNKYILDNNYIAETCDNIQITGFSNL